VSLRSTGPSNVKTVGLVDRQTSPLGCRATATDPASWARANRRIGAASVSSSGASTLIRSVIPLVWRQIHPDSASATLGVPRLTVGSNHLSESLVHPRGNDVGCPIGVDGDLLGAELGLDWWERDCHDLAETDVDRLGLGVVVNRVLADLTADS
jgi:hypothetical protein